MNFDHIVGHEKLKIYIDKSIKLGIFSHAHLFIGEDGIGKSLLAKASAIKILNGQIDKNYADIIEFKVEKNKKSIGIDQVRKINEEINKKPYEGDKKVVIVYEVDKMTEEAQNAFLKTIEEPPKGVFIILLCESLSSVLDTVKSRCQIHKLQRLSSMEMCTYIKNKYPKVSEDELKVMVTFSEGIPGRAEKFLTDVSFKEIRDTVIKILKELNDSNVDVMKFEVFFIKYKNDWKEILSWFLTYVRDIMIYKEIGNKDMLVNIDKYDEIKDLANMFSFNKLNDIIYMVNDTQKKLSRNVNLSLVFQVMLIKIKDL